ncbi:hypothetical protein HU200_045616 [Digitaria exilis]|uniref:AB hydrolase-1 domain-containing protein n=1 Tax=Digitaria exilis TaxID=1010633 RepID=A0A835BAX6_9POAL|nr:hypothetical protein HU200_045616 [Digitaria exilis]
MATLAWARAAIGAASSALAAAVFAVLDVVDVVLCVVYALLDGILEESPVRCYCRNRPEPEPEPEEEEEGMSDTLYARRSAIRDALLGLVVRRRRRTPAVKWRSSPRWSDCACKSCVAWQQGRGERLHVVVKEPDPSTKGITLLAFFANAASGTSAVFIHGFTSSSSFWAETVFREGSSLLHSSTRLLAVDLLGFGQSPKPGNCMYTLKDHVEAIERTLLIDPPPHNNLMSSFHLVGHSMGCIIALALAAKHPTRVKSITLVAPVSTTVALNLGDFHSNVLLVDPLVAWQPYFLACEQKAASQVALRRLAEKKLWPPLLFGSAVMSWYEHIGRTVCLVLCKNHLLWEWLLRLVTGKRDVDFRVRDLTRHTHHSAWHTMHNVICGGAALQDANLEAVQAAAIPVMLIHGVDDPVVPVDCSRHHLKAKLPRAQLRLIPGCDHTTVVSGRERSFAQELTAFWSSGCSVLASHNRSSG